MDLRRNHTKLTGNIEKAKIWWARIKGAQSSKSHETFDADALRPATRNGPGDNAAPPAKSFGEDRW
jgi:hypothetical protein